MVPIIKEEGSSLLGHKSLNFILTETSTHPGRLVDLDSQSSIFQRFVYFHQSFALIVL